MELAARAWLANAVHPGLILRGGYSLISLGTWYLAMCMKHLKSPVALISSAETDESMLWVIPKDAKADRWWSMVRFTHLTCAF